VKRREIIIIESRKTFKQKPTTFVVQIKLKYRGFVDVLVCFASLCSYSTSPEIIVVKNVFYVFYFSIKNMFFNVFYSVYVFYF